MPTLLEARFKLEDVAAMTDDDLLEAIGRKRGALQGGKRINLQKAAEMAIYDFRAAVMGRITLETPEEFAQWLAAGQILDAQRQVKKDAIELDRKIRFKKIRDLDNCTIQGLTKRRWVMSSSSRAASQNDTRSNTGAVLSQSLPPCRFRNVSFSPSNWVITLNHAAIKNTNQFS
jgi:hypothetical protein